MFGWDDAQNDYNKASDAKQSDNQASLSHELVAGAASFYAMHEFENHQRSEGEEVDHSFAKEALAGLAGAGVDHFAETSGEDFIDKEKAKHEAKKKTEQLYDQQYGDQPNYNPNTTEKPAHLKHGKRH